MDDPEDEESTVRKPAGPESVADDAEPYVVLLQGASIGRVYKLTQGESEIGRSINADIQLEDDGVSRVHAQLVRDAEHTIRLVDRSSTNGSFVNGIRVEDRVLEHGDMIQIGKNVVLKFTLQSDVEGNYAEQLYEAATRDALTGLLNRRFFDEQLAKDVAHALRHEAPLSVLVFDIDFFKKVNDTYGHPAGDKVLAELGKVVQSSVRAEDVACRLGGEEFAIVMRDTGWAAAQTMAERLRLAVEEHTFEVGDVTLAIAVSVGTGTLDGARHTEAAMVLEEADQAMYKAKRRGRNRVVAGPQPAGEAHKGSAPYADLKKTLT